jgi:hypothetical protein
MKSKKLKGQKEFYPNRAFNTSKHELARKTKKKLYVYNNKIQKKPPR